MLSKKEIGRLNQAKGHRFEIRIWNRGKCKDLLDRAISSGSKGIVDVWLLYPKKLRIICCKTNGYLDPKERRKINWLLAKKPEWATIELAFYKSKRKIGKMIIDKNWEDRYTVVYSKLKSVHQKKRR